MGRLVEHPPQIFISLRRPTAVDCNQINSRCSSLGMVANRRRCGFSSGPLASKATTINTFLCTSIPAIFIASSWRGSGRTHAKRLHTVTCYHPPTQMGGATQIGSKRAFRIKLRNGLTSSRVYTDLRRPRSISVHAQTRPDFHVNGWTAGPYELSMNSNSPDKINPAASRVRNLCCRCI